MVSIDDRLYETLTSAARGGWLRRPRWLLLPVALPLFLAGGLAVGTLVNLAFNGDFASEGGGLLGPAPAVAADAGTAIPGGACGRIQYIVDKACSLQQRDHDAWAIRQCVDRELKYTMWSAYGCR